jgi:hypothetical protein
MRRTPAVFREPRDVLSLLAIWILDGGQAIAALGRADRIWLLTAGVAWRIFTKDMPAGSSKVSLAYYIGVSVFLVLVLHLIPGQGFRARWCESRRGVETPPPL